MLTTAATLFALAALGGIAMVAMHLKGKTIPLGLAIVHGLVAAVALVLVIVVVVGGGAGDLVTYALILFVVAALGGFVLFASQLKGKRLSTPLIFVHAIVGVIGFVLLLTELFGGA